MLIGSWVTRVAAEVGAVERKLPFPSQHTGNKRTLAVAVLGFVVCVCSKSNV